MPSDSIELDGHRSNADQRATEIRRRLKSVQADQQRLEVRQQEFEAFIMAGPAANWPEAAAKAQYLIQLLIDVYAVRDPRQRDLIKSVFDDFAHLIAIEDSRPGLTAGPDPVLPD